MDGWYLWIITVFVVIELPNILMQNKVPCMEQLQE